MKQILNHEDLERAFGNRAAHLYHVEAKNWVHTVAVEHLLTIGLRNPTLADRDKEFLPYTETFRPDPFMTIPAVLPVWAGEALRRGEPVYLFNSVQPRKREFWRTLEHIIDWFNRNGEKPTDTDYTHLSFPDAAQNAEEWRARAEKDWKDKHGS